MGVRAHVIHPAQVPVEELVQANVTDHAWVLVEVRVTLVQALAKGLVTSPAR